jgi:hypothetical protein
VCTRRPARRARPPPTSTPSITFPGCSSGSLRDDASAFQDHGRASLPCGTDVLIRWLVRARRARTRSGSSDRARAFKSVNDLPKCTNSITSAVVRASLVGRGPRARFPAAER